MAQILSNSIILNITRIAFNNKEFCLLLSGEGRYKCDVNRYVPANIPTDWNRIIKHGIYALYNEKTNINVVDDFIDAIRQLLGKNALHVWIAYSVVWFQLYNEHNIKSPFQIITPDLLQEVKTALQNNTDELKTIREWQGTSENNGLWEDITKRNEVLHKEFGIVIL